MNVKGALLKLAAVSAIGASIAFAALLTLSQMRSTQMLTEDRVRLERYMDGTAARPFVRRVLVPTIIRGTVAIMPEGLASGLERALKPANKLLLPKDGSGTLRPLYYYVLAAVLTASLLGYALLCFLLYRQLFGASAFAISVPPLALLILIPFVAIGFGHIYDFTVLFLMSALLLAMARGRHRLFLILFVISCFNKETTILITVAYGCYFYDQLPRKAFIAHVAAQIVCFALIQGVLRHLFAANPGMNMELWYAQQIPWLMSQSFPQFAAFLFLVVLVAFGWNHKPLLIQRSMFQLLPHLGLIFIGNYPGELRALYDSVPLLVLAACRTLEWLPEGGRASIRSAVEPAT